MALPRNVVQEDRRLEKQTETASAALLEHRWHWTLAESNAKRVAIREYAREVGKQESIIRRDAKAHVLLARGDARTPSEARERANMGVETAAAASAVAQARGTQIEHTRKTRGHEIRRVREIARQKAEDKGTSVAEEAPKVAEWIVKSELAYPWQANRIGDTEARLETILAVSTSVARSTHGRTMVGKKARKIKSTVGYLLNELRDLSDGEEE